MLFELPRGHARVATYLRVILKTLLLAFTRVRDALANRRRRFFSPFAGNVAIFDRWHFDVQIDAVEQRARNTLAISLHLYRAATAFAFKIGKIPAWARIHGCDQHELGRKRDAACRARHSDFPVLKRLAHHL